MRAYRAKQVAELDRYTIEELGVDLRQLMEVAGLRSAEAAKAVLESGSVVVLIGPVGMAGMRSCVRSGCGFGGMTSSSSFRTKGQR